MRRARRDRSGTVDAARLVYYGLYALQRRGQESCGIVVNDDGVFFSHKDMGLVSEVFSADTLSSLPQGSMAVGHVRYGTTGGARRSNCQPLEVNHQKGRMALAHNGNLSNAAELRNALELSGAIFHTTSDTETIAYIVTRERLRAGKILAQRYPGQARGAGGRFHCAGNDERAHREASAGGGVKEIHLRISSPPFLQQK